MGSKCSSCQHYNQGHGSNYCVKKCKEFKYLLPRRRTVNFVRVPEEILAEVPDEHVTTHLKALDIHSATVLLQRTILNASLTEIAEYHGMSRQAIHYKIKEAIKIIRRNVAGI